jgi:hypothetical protein
MSGASIDSAGSTIDSATNMAAALSVVPGMGGGLHGALGRNDCLNASLNVSAM